MRPGTNASDGFSLIEALVALVVLAIATVGLIGAVEQHIDSTRGMERRATAMWVAENRMAEVTLGDPGANAREVAMLGQAWQVGVVRNATDDPEIGKVRVQVTAPGDKSPSAVLDGFLDLGANRRVSGGRRS